MPNVETLTLLLQNKKTKHYMKKTLSFFFVLLMSCITMSAQIQNGYVRSQGTSYNRNGSPLKGAKVFVKGLNGAKVTAANGTFNFNLGGGKTQFSIKDVILKGHTLLTPLAPAYNVGKAAVEIVMQSREERRQNEARISKIIEERITKTYNGKTRELQKKIAALEKALSDKQQNTEDLKCQIHALKEQLEYLDDQYLKRNELIDKMVEEYVNLDYATMDNRKAELCSYIESGELEKADSLLNTIDINKEMNDIKTLNQDIEEKESMLAMLPKEKEIRKNKIETVCIGEANMILLFKICNMILRLFSLGTWQTLTLLILTMSYNVLAFSTHKIVSRKQNYTI